jgi:hypothetical protein
VSDGHLMSDRTASSCEVRSVGVVYRDDRLIGTRRAGQQCATEAWRTEPSRRLSDQLLAGYASPSVCRILMRVRHEICAPMSARQEANSERGRASVRRQALQPGSAMGHQRHR